LPPLQPAVSQNVQEGYRLVGPAGVLTPVVVHVQWMDNHPAGPDTHVMISFEDGSNIEFPWHVALTMLWPDERRAVPDTDIAAAAPEQWGASAPPWR
jgi:hypothetical protein